MHIAVTGEGPTDYGRAEYGKPGQWIEGPVQVYMKRIAEEKNADIQLNMIDRAEVQKVKLQKRQLAGVKGKAIPSRKFYVFCKNHEYEYGVYYCDADRTAGEKNSNLHQLESRYEEIYDEVNEGLHNDEKFIPMIPCRMIENWILSDEGCIKNYMSIAKTGYNASKTEILWGKDSDPDSEYPKNVFERLKNSSKNRQIRSNSNRELFVEIAENQNLEILRKNCPISFERFYVDYVKLLELE